MCRRAIVRRSNCTSTEYQTFYNSYFFNNATSSRELLLQKSYFWETAYFSKKQDSTASNSPGELHFQNNSFLLIVLVIFITSTFFDQLHLENKDFFSTATVLEELFFFQGPIIPESWRSEFKHLRAQRLDSKRPCDELLDSKRSESKRPGVQSPGV